MFLRELQRVFVGQTRCHVMLLSAGTRVATLLADLAWIGGPCVSLGVGKPCTERNALACQHYLAALRALGTQITVEFGGPSADHGVLAFLWGLGTQIAVWVGLPRAEPEARALRKALRGERCNCASLVRFCPREAIGSPLFVCKSANSGCLRGYARKYTTFVDHLHVIMCLPLHVALILLFVKSRSAWNCL